MHRKTAAPALLRLRGKILPPQIARLRTELPVLVHPHRDRTHRTDLRARDEGIEHILHRIGTQHNVRVEEQDDIAVRFLQSHTQRMSHGAMLL